jgi:hypothetical protein
MLLLQIGTELADYCNDGILTYDLDGGVRFPVWCAPIQIN